MLLSRGTSPHLHVKKLKRKRCSRTTLVDAPLFLRFIFTAIDITFRSRENAAYMLLKLGNGERWLTE